jgi:hypothetical protein
VAQLCRELPQTCAFRCPSTEHVVGELWITGKRTIVKDGASRSDYSDQGTCGHSGWCVGCNGHNSTRHYVHLLDGHTRKAAVRVDAKPSRFVANRNGNVPSGYDLDARILKEKDDGRRVSVHLNRWNNQWDGLR